MSRFVPWEELSNEEKLRILYDSLNFYAIKPEYGGAKVSDEVAKKRRDEIWKKIQEIESS